MSLQIGPTLSGGIDRALSRNGLVLLLANLVLGSAWLVAVVSALAAVAARYGVDPSVTALPTLPLPFPALAASALALLVAFAWLNVVAVRTFVDGRGSSIPDEFFTRRVGYVLVNVVAFGVLFALAVSGPALVAVGGGILVGRPLAGALVGVALLVVPGVVAYVALLFGQFYVAVDDENALAALSNSRSLTKGNRVRLFLVVSAVFVATSALTTLVSVGGTALLGSASPVAGFANAAVGYVASLLSLAVLAEAFCRLRDERGEAPTAAVA